MWNAHGSLDTLFTLSQARRWFWTVICACFPPLDMRVHLSSPRLGTYDFTPDRLLCVSQMQEILLQPLRRVRGSRRGSKKTLEINPDSPIIQVGPGSSHVCTVVLGTAALRQIWPYCL